MKNIEYIESLNADDIINGSIGLILFDFVRFHVSIISCPIVSSGSELLSFNSLVRSGQSSSIKGCGLGLVRKEKHIDELNAIDVNMIATS